MPRLWKDKTTDELREEWHELVALKQRSNDPFDGSLNKDLDDAIEAIELEIGRRKVPLVNEA